jgi:anti-sigma factor RsiW
MTTELCNSVSDKLPRVASGELEWTTEEAAHLAACPECAAEWRLTRRARVLGDQVAAAIDPASLSARVLAGVAARRRRDRWTRGAWVTTLVAAAAIAIVVWTGGRHREGSVAVGPDSNPVVTADAGFHLPLAELESLDSDQLESVLDGLDAPVGEVAPGPAPSFGDLDDHQLERVLRSLEG